MILISHDLGLVAGTADHIVVMYAGRTVEQADVYRRYAAPGHPYTRALLGSAPRPVGGGRPLPAIPGLPPSPTSIPGGCPFHPRCPHAQQICRSTPSRAYRWASAGTAPATSPTGSFPERQW